MNDNCKPKDAKWRMRRPTPTPEAHARIASIYSCPDFEQKQQLQQEQTQTATGDVISRVLGNFGIWQLRSVLIIFLCKLPAAWFMALIIFTAPEMYANKEYWCDTSAYGGTANISVSEDQCYVLAAIGDSNYAIRQCQKFNYAHRFHSLIMEFDLVCLADIFVAWSQYWHLFGMFLGGVVATRLMRVLSPRRLYISGLGGLICCGTATGLVNDFSLHCSFRCLSAVCCCFMMTAGQVIFCDITAGKYRRGVLLFYDAFWSVGVLLLPAIAAFSSSWRQVYVGITSLPIGIVLLLPWLPDSPRWLLQHAEPTAAVEQVQQMLLLAARINERCSRLPQDLCLQLQLLADRLRSQPPAASWLELWRGYARSKLHMLATHMALACFLISHMGLLLSVRTFGRDYLATNTLGIGLAEILGCLLAVHLCLRHNPSKWQWAGGFCISSGTVGFLCWLLGYVEMPEVYEILLWTLFAALPKVGVSCAQSMLSACMDESLPQAERAPFTFSVVTWARVWLLSASFLTMLKQINIALSLSTFCALVILGGICICCLRTPINETERLIEVEVERRNGENGIERNEAACYNTHL